MTKLLQLPLVSFIVTSYNYENYVLKTLESIKNQTYENIEIIIVDDKSCDNSVEKIKGFIKENSELEIKLFEHDKNKGQMAAIQKGLAYTNGQFICCVDSDDILIKDYAKTLIRVHMSCSVAVVSAQVVEIGLNDEIHTTYSVSSFQKEKKYELKSLENLLDIDVENVDFDVLDLKKAPFGGWYWSAMSANMFRKSVLELFINYDTPQNWLVCPDKFLLNFVHLIGSSAIVYAPLIGYRRHGLNAGDSSSVCGLKRYNNNKTKFIYSKTNKSIVKDISGFIKKNKKQFEKQLGKNNVRKILIYLKLSPILLICHKVKKLITGAVK